MVSTEGNLLLDRLMGAQVLLHPYPPAGKTFETIKLMFSQYESKLRLDDNLIPDYICSR